MSGPHRCRGCSGCRTAVGFRVRPGPVPRTYFGTGSLGSVGMRAARALIGPGGSMATGPLWPVRRVLAFMQDEQVVVRR
ncbi:hypothetical protein ACFQ61_37195, partial [Streptomyces sp. NPDC056500]|uniref:hypothetical protein n=1 Tax=Streptomyces sp. NPDC056500 TaxID=3345840 RepID=UPI0036BB2951